MMPISNTLDIYEKQIKINKLNADFWQRMVLLTTASVEGFEKRAQRMNSYCGETISDELVELTKSCNVVDLNNVSMKLVEKCTGVSLEELHNAEQVVLVTQEELWYWADLLITAWLNLAHSMSPKAVSH